MSRRARARADHPRRVATNAIDIAINGARKLSRADVDGHHALMMRAKREFCQGINCELHWLSLADAANVAETFASMGLGAGQDAEDVIRCAQEALAAVHQRHQLRGSWTLYSDEIDALGWLVHLHNVQMSACSYSEFSRAMDQTAMRVAQARAGNAPAGAIVVVGQIAEARP